jgi:hypothetical protein
MMPTYSSSSSLNGPITPPKRLILAFPGTGLAGGGWRTERGGSIRLSGIGRAGPQTTYDAVTVLLFSAPITIESWFPNGAPRVATVQLTFKEVIQKNASGSTSITYVGSNPYRYLGTGYKYSGRVDQIATSGG